MDLQGVADGALYAVQSPLALAAVLVAALASRPGGPRAAAFAALALAAASLAALAWPDRVPATPVHAGVLIAIGVFVASNQRAPRWWSLLALLPCGLAAGLAGGLATATPAEAAGTVAVLLAVALATLAAPAAVRLPARVQHGAAIARRMAAAWIAAVGLLMLALWWRGAVA